MKYLKTDFNKIVCNAMEQGTKVFLCKIQFYNFDFNFDQLKQLTHFMQVHTVTLGTGLILHKVAAILRGS